MEMDAAIQKAFAPKSDHNNVLCLWSEFLLTGRLLQTLLVVCLILPRDVLMHSDYDAHHSLPSLVTGQFCPFGFRESKIKKTTTQQQFSAGKNMNYVSW